MTEPRQIAYIVIYSVPVNVMDRKNTLIRGLTYSANLFSLCPIEDTSVRVTSMFPILMRASDIELVSPFRLTTFAAKEIPAF